MKKIGRAVALRPPPKQTKKGKQKMNPRKLMAVALCAAACVTTTAFAEDDFGIESASPVAIADPVNPQPGMLFRAYQIDNKFLNADGLKGSIAKLPSQPAVKTLVDKGEEFSLKQIGKSDAKVGMWSGFMKCKRAGAYTLTLTQPTRWSGKSFGASSGGYSLRINGKPVIPASMKQTSADVNLKVGWNKVELVCQFGVGRVPALTITYKPKDSLSEARPLTPGMMFFDKKPEEDW